MDLLTPAFGLIFWQLVVFGLLVFMLGRYAWRPMLRALDEREAHIENSLKQADDIQHALKESQAQHETLVQEGYKERDRLMAQARVLAEKLETEAKQQAQQIADQQLQEAQRSIKAEEKAAQGRLRAMVVDLSVQLTERVLREQLADSATARALIEKYVKELAS